MSHTILQPTPDIVTHGDVWLPIHWVITASLESILGLMSRNCGWAKTQVYLRDRSSMCTASTDQCKIPSRDQVAGGYHHVDTWVSTNLQPNVVGHERRGEHEHLQRGSLCEIPRV